MQLANQATRVNRAALIWVSVIPQFAARIRLVSGQIAFVDSRHGGRLIVGRHGNGVKFENNVICQL